MRLLLLLTTLLSVHVTWAQYSQDLKAVLKAQITKAHHSVGYDNAKRNLFGSLHLEQVGNDYVIRDVYCEKTYSKSDFPKGAGPEPDRVPNQEVLNTEHTWPQSKFGGSAPRDVQKSDLHHLFPTDKDLNSIRGNEPFGEVQSSDETLKCNRSKIGRSPTGRVVFEPPSQHKGNVARALFYFSVRYSMPIDREQENYLRRWHNEDPVDSFEMERNDGIEKIQGNRNPFIDHPEYVDQIADF